MADAWSVSELKNALERESNVSASQQADLSTRLEYQKRQQCGETLSRMLPMLRCR